MSAFSSVDLRWAYRDWVGGRGFVCVDFVQEEMEKSYPG